jgi:hypothetical protein
VSSAVHRISNYDRRADKNIVLASDTGLNDRAAHLAKYGSSNLLAAWETSSTAGDPAYNDASRKMYVQTLNRATGATDGGARSPSACVAIGIRTSSRSRTAAWLSSRRGAPRRR